MIRYFVVCLIILLMTTACDNESKLHLSSVLDSGMILQRNSKNNIWGWSSPYSKITVSTDWGSEITTSARLDSSWSVSIDIPEADLVNHTIRVSAKDTSIILNNILFGDIWLAGGQDNMEIPLFAWPADTVCGGQVTSMTDAPDSMLRFFNTEKVFSIHETKNIKGAWSTDSINTRRIFSATAYYFARKLRKSLNIPIGIISTAWSGTLTESWISAAYLPSSTEPKYHSWHKRLKEFSNECDNYEKWLLSHPTMPIAWGPKGEDPYTLLHFNDEYVNNISDDNKNSWGTISVPTFWSNTPIGEIQGICWFIKYIKIPSDWIKEDLTLHLGSIDDRDVTYVNGFYIGDVLESDGYAKQRIYSIPGAIIANSHLTIAIQVINTDLDGGFRGCPDGPMRIENKNNKSISISIEGDWHYRMAAIKYGYRISYLDLSKDELSQCPRPSILYNEYAPTVLHNAILQPLSPFKIKGVLWFQGGSIPSDAKTNYLHNRALVHSLRSTFGDGICFYQAQIPHFPYWKEVLHEANNTRLGQFTCLMDIPNTATISTIDLGSETTMKPPYKREFGERFALLALGEDCGPKPISIRVSDPSIVISFENKEGLTIDYSQPNLFEVAGEDGEYFPATTYISNLNEVYAFSHCVPHPISVRYGYDKKTKGTLTNKSSIPCVAFELKVKK